MPTIRDLYAQLESSLGAAVSRLGGPADFRPSFATVPNPELGDLAIPCFALRGQLSALDEKARNNPGAIAAALANALEEPAVERAQAAGPYLNLRLRGEDLARTVIGDALTHGERFGAPSDGAVREHVVIEFSAPNTNKPQHLGHVRNNVLGESVSRILGHAGHRVSKVNLVNDRGIHICKSMLAYELWADGATPESTGVKGDHLVGEYYVMFDRRFNEEYKAWLAADDGKAAYAAWLESPDGDKAQKAWAAWEARQAQPVHSDARKKPARAPEEPAKLFAKDFKDTYFNQHSPLGKRARQLLVDWENEEPSVRALWQRLNGWVLDGFTQTYGRLGIHFDRVYYESQTYKLGKQAVERGLAMGVFRPRDNAVVFDLAQIGEQGEKIVLRSDGTSVYMTQDLGTALARYQELGFERMIYVVADEQNYHFKVLFGALAKLEPALTGRCEHLAYGLVLLPQGRMKTREGTVVDADELMDEMRRLASEVIAQRLESEHYANTDEAEQRFRAERIGLAGLKYYLLDVTPQSTMEFDPEKSIDLQGRTGAYCLMSYARTRSLLRKAGGAPSFDPSVLGLLTSPDERRVLLELLQWPTVLGWAAVARDPSKIAEFLFNLCKAFAFVFTDRVNHPIATCPDPALRSARLQLVQALGVALQVGLGLLGIDTIEEM